MTPPMSRTSLTSAARSIRSTWCFASTSPKKRSSTSPSTANTAALWQLDGELGSGCCGGCRQRGAGSAAGGVFFDVPPKPGTRRDAAVGRCERQIEARICERPHGIRAIGLIKRSGFVGQAADLLRKVVRCLPVRVGRRAVDDGLCERQRPHTEALDLAIDLGIVAGFRLIRHYITPFWPSMPCRTPLRRALRRGPSSRPTYWHP